MIKLLCNEGDKKMNEKKEHLLLVDGMALLFRAFFATSVHGQFMRNSSGVPMNGINGLLKHLLTAINTLQPTHVICCWDMGSKTYRTELYPAYKGNRGEPPVELIPQFDLAKDAVAALNIPNIGVINFEADDCIGTIIEKHHENMEISVLTGDRDLLQLLKPNINIVLLQKGIGNYKSYSMESFIEEMGVHPKMLIDIKALMGDTSDNYPGVKGIGEKTAYKLIAQYESIEMLLNNLAELTKGQRTKIEADLDMLHLSRKLAEINCTAPIEYVLEESVLNIEYDKAEKMMEQLELKGLQSFFKNIITAV